LDTSDIDVYGFCIAPLNLTFPHTAGEIPGFGNQIQKFNHWQEDHIHDASSGKVYDITCYGITRFFQLCLENNPNMLDALFVPRRCILHSTGISEIVRDNRHLFLHKGSMSKFRGYAYSQLNKLENHANSSNPKRASDIKRVGYDTKFLMHLVRLLLQVEQILTEHDLDIERNSEILKSIRRGGWSLEQGKEWFFHKEKFLEEIHTKSTLRERPDEETIKGVLIRCLEHHYGSLTNILAIPTRESSLLNELTALVEKYR
jgi:hypothetical protein